VCILFGAGAFVLVAQGDEDHEPATTMDGAAFIVLQMLFTGGADTSYVFLIAFGGSTALVQPHWISQATAPMSPKFQHASASRIFLHASAPCRRA